MAANVPNEVEEAIKSMTAQEGVDQYVIYNSAGVVVRFAGLENDTAVALVANVTALLAQTKIKVEEIMQQGETVELVRLKTKKYEIIVSSKMGWTIVVLQTMTKPVEDAAPEEEA